MLKLLITILIVNLLTCVPFSTVAQQKASDFFRNPAKERDLMKSLFDKKKPTQKNGEIKPFTLTGEAGLLITSGNTDTSIIKIAVESNHETENWSNTYQSQYLRRVNTINRIDSSQEIETQRIEVSAQFDYKLVEPNNRLFAYLEFDDNEFNRLREQATIVMGWSQVAWQNKQSEFRYSIGPGYSHLVQERRNQKIEEMIVRGTLYYKHTFGNDALFRQTISAELGEEISKARTQSSLSAKIFDKVAMKFSIDLIFNNSVANQDSDLSTRTSISMVYQFF